MLSVLTAASRVSTNTNVNNKYMETSKIQYIFHFDKLLKSWKNDQPYPSVSYSAFP